MTNSSEKGLSENILAQYWEKFSLFPTKWANFLFSRSYNIYILLIITYVVALSFILPFDQWDWKAIISLIHLHILPIGAILVFWGYFRWKSLIPTTLTWASKRSYSENIEDDNITPAFHEFLNEYQSTLHSRIGLIITSLPLPIIVLMPIIWLFLTLGKVYNLASSVPMLVFFCFWAFIVGVASRPVYVTAMYIKKFFGRFRVNIQPYHPDGCGGLEPIGDFCFALSLPIMIALVTLSMVGIGVFLVPSWGEVGTILGAIIVSPQLAYSALIIIVCFVLPFTWLAFFLPLKEIHYYMQDCKRNDFDAMATSISLLQQQVFSSFASGEINEDKGKIKRLDEMIKLSKTRYPVWPFRTKVVILLFSPQVISIAGLVLSIYEHLD